MPTYSKPHGDFQNLTQTADATQVNDQINQLYTAMNGGLDVTNVPTLGDVTTLATTAKTSVVAGINEIYANYPIGAMSRQALINGNFDIPQRGTSFTNPAHNVYTLDRYITGVIPDSGILPTNVIHSRQVQTSGDIANSYYFYRVNVDGAGSSFGANSFYRISQRIENGTRYLCGNGKKVTVSFWAKSSVANKKIGIHLSQFYGTGGTPTVVETINGNKWTLTNVWTKYTFTFTTNTLAGKTFGTNNDDYLALVFSYQWGTNIAPTVGDTVAESFVGAGNIDIAQVGFNAGDQALPFQPKDVEDENRKSLRYVWVPQTNSVFIRATTYTANTLVFDVPLPVQLRTTPTIRGTVNTDIIVNTVAGVAQTGFTAAATLTSNGVRVTMTKSAHGLTDAYMEIKTTSGFDAEL